jgi:hypothetical protein
VSASFEVKASAFVAVTGITDVPATATAGTPLALTSTVAPADATNQTIAWSVQNAGSTGATIVEKDIYPSLHTTAAGTATVRATIANGTAPGTAFTKDFPITVSAATSAPVFTTHPKDVTAYVGEEATFTVVVTGNPTPTLQWEASLDGGTTWFDVYNQTNATYIGGNLITSISGTLVRCVATNRVATVRSNIAMLTVLDPDDGGANRFVIKGFSNNTIESAVYAFTGNYATWSAAVMNALNASGIGSVTKGQNYVVWGKVPPTGNYYIYLESETGSYKKAGPVTITNGVGEVAYSTFVTIPAY